MEVAVTKLLFLMLLYCLLILQCTEKIDGDERIPPTPLLFAAPPDTALFERGIDAIPDFDGIQLDWYAGDITDIAGFTIYRHAAGETQYKKLTTADSRDSSFIDLNAVQVGVRYHYFMRSVSYDGVESAPSDTVNYMLLSKALHLFNSLSRTPTFQWQVSDYPDQYVLKLFDLLSNEKVWFAVVRSDYTNQDEEVAFNFDGKALDSLSTGRSYRWRVDIIGAASNSGSESNWKQFTVEQ